MILGCVSAIWRKEVGLSYCEKNNFDGDVLFNVCPLTRRDVRAFLPQLAFLACVVLTNAIFNSSRCFFCELPLNGIVPKVASKAK